MGTEPTDPQPDDRRAAALNALVDLAEEHQLRLPMAVNLHGTGTVNLRIDDEDYAGVAAWATALHLGPVHARDVPRNTCEFVSVRAERSFDGGWHGWSTVTVWAACWRDMPVRDDAQSGGVA